MENNLDGLRKTPRIAIDALGINEAGGGRTATLPLIKAIVNKKKDWQFYCFLSQFEQELNFQNVKQIILPVSKGVFSRFLTQLVFPFFILINKIDLIHFIKSQASFVFFTKRIMTIYDCTILNYPEFFGKLSYNYWKYIQPIMCRHMNHIITISNHAKCEIEKQLNVPIRKISVIYPASQFIDEETCENTTIQAIRNKHKIPNEYLLYVGQIGMKKNLQTLITAYSILKKEYDYSQKLILVGPRYRLSDAGFIFNLIESLDLENYVLYLAVLNQNELKLIIRNAVMLLFPSLHEGFGIPLIESMQLGTPVISSNVSVMPEVISDAGLLVDDYLNPEAWVDKINELSTNDDLQKKLIQKGHIRAQLFSWEMAGKKLVEVYENELHVNYDNNHEGKNRKHR